ncbi:universal stress protein [Flagellimonas aquimarina]|uniref:Universal stress protein n=1 Tax=Flagellimonas aquimarina TaxID=2201895 RepID=A0A316KVM5_9FLAO|nr:universal stress protein [Allomuricauda koreensis]PWL37656.1 universal stress protein [Allomuricauda koreensis]
MINILLPTDFSENAFNAICHGIRLFEDSTCVFYLMHAYTPAIYRVDYMIGSPGKVGLPDDHQQIAQTHLEETRKKLETRFKNPRHTFVTHAAFNNLADEVQNTVENENIDIVVMGTQGATGAKEIFLGSNTVHVLRKTKVPVLTIPVNAEYKPLNHILFPTDLEIEYSAPNLDYLLDLAKLHKAKIHIMHVTSPYGLSKDQKKNKVLLEKTMATSNHEFHDLPDQEVIGAINSFQTEHDIQLLAMVQNKHTFLERLFVEPVIRKIGLHTLVPFLVLPYNAKA